MKYFAIILAGVLWMGHLPAQNHVQKLAFYGPQTKPSPTAQAFLGIYSEQLSEEKARKLGFDNLYGSYVTRIVENSAAERAGVLPFDYIFGIDEYRTGKEQNLTQIIKRYESGQDATLHLYRQSKKQTLEVAFGSRSENAPSKRDKCQDPFLGISATKLKEGVNQGITVNIVSNSTAESIGMEDGDHVIAINGYRMLDWQDISTAINALEVGDKITVEFLRDGQKQQLKGPIKSYCETKPDEGFSFELEQAPRPGQWFDRYFKKGDAVTIITNGADEVNVDIRDMSTDEAQRARREKSIELEAANNLSIEGLSIEPEDESFELEFTLPGNGPTIIRIYNELGRLIYQYDLGEFSGAFRDEVNLSQNKDSQYYLEIRQGRRSASKKITLSSD